MDCNHFSSTKFADGQIKLVSNKKVHKNHIDEAFVLAVEDINDVVIVTKDKEEIIANKNVLSIFSSLIRPFLSDTRCIIFLPDCNSSSVKHVLGIITNSFINIEKESLKDLNDIIETAKVMDIDMSNIYVEQSMSSGFISPSNHNDQVTASTNEDKTVVADMDSSLQVVDGGELWWLSGFSAFDHDEEQIDAATGIDTKSSGISGKDDEGIIRDCSSDFVNSPLDKNDGNSMLHPGFPNLDPPSKSENFSPQLNSTELDETVLLDTDITIKGLEKDVHGSLGQLSQDIREEKYIPGPSGNAGEDIKAFPNEEKDILCPSGQVIEAGNTVPDPSGIVNLVNKKRGQLHSRLHSLFSMSK